LVGDLLTLDAGKKNSAANFFGVQIGGAAQQQSVQRQ